MRIKYVQYFGTAVSKTIHVIIVKPLYNLTYVHSF